LLYRSRGVRRVQKRDTPPLKGGRGQTLINFSPLKHKYELREVIGPFVSMLG